MLTLALALMIATTPVGGPGELVVPSVNGGVAGLVSGGAGPGSSISSSSSSGRPGLVGVGNVGSVSTPEPSGVSDRTVTVIFSFAAATAIAGFTLWLLSPLDDDDEAGEDEGGLDVIPLLGVDEGAVSAGLRLGF